MTTRWLSGFWSAVTCHRFSGWRLVAQHDGTSPATPKRRQVGALQSDSVAIVSRFLSLSVQLSLFLIFCAPLLAVTYEPSTIVPPKPLREFRGVWIATVANIDWPSKPGLPVAKQKAELLAILDRAAELKLNAVIFQVRPACDAFYASKFEPWSEYLNGKMGKAPQPFYDPLEFAIEEAHKRGLELHAWFNPYRALHFSSRSPVATNHISKTRPDLVRHYGAYLWLDPGESDVQDYTLSVVMDVVRRYDVDGIHFDDYFYPYAERGADGRSLNFPDDRSWRKYGARSGMSREDWRRGNVNAFVERAYNSVKAAKPWVKVGISPFGIWRPKYPSQIQGKDAYAELYADARKWLTKGWLDYCAPQLYWPIAKREQSFTALLDWWNDQNLKQRHIWPGMNSVKVLDEWKPAEIVNQIRLAARQPVSAGHIHYNMKAMMESAELRMALARGPNLEPALVPASPWMGREVKNRPNFFLSATTSDNLRIVISPPDPVLTRCQVLQIKNDGKWTTEFLPARTVVRILGAFHPEAIAVTAIDRFGNAGPTSVWERKGIQRER